MEIEDEQNRKDERTLLSYLSLSRPLNFQFYPQGCCRINNIPVSVVVQIVAYSHTLTSSATSSTWERERECVCVCDAVRVRVSVFVRDYVGGWMRERGMCVCESERMTTLLKELTVTDNYRNVSTYVPEEYPWTHFKSILTLGTPGWTGGGFLGVFTAPNQGLTHPDSSPPVGGENRSRAVSVSVVVGEWPWLAPGNKIVWLIKVRNNYYCKFINLYFTIINIITIVAICVIIVF